MNMSLQCSVLCLWQPRREMSCTSKTLFVCTVCTLYRMIRFNSCLRIEPSLFGPSDWVREADPASL